jgi:hypothetical protein
MTGDYDLQPDATKGGETTRLNWRAVPDSEIAVDKFAGLGILVDPRGGRLPGR